MQVLAPSVLWFPSQLILIKLARGPRQWFGPGMSDCITQSVLVLTPHLQKTRRLCVHKSRYMMIQDHEQALNEILDDYQFIEDGWRGAVEVSDSDWAYLTLVSN